MLSGHDKIAVWDSSENEIDKLAAILGRDGIVLLDGVSSAQQVVQLGRRLGTIAVHPHGRRSGITSIVPRDGAVQAPGMIGLTRSGLLPHTDRTVLPIPPNLIIQVLTLPSGSGGEATLADGERVVSEVGRSHPEILETLWAPGTVTFRSGEEEFRSQILSFFGRGRWILRFRDDGGLLADSSVSSLLPLLRDIIQEYTIVLPNVRGCAYIADNWRMLHGRRAFSGTRRAQRLLVDATDDRFTGKLGVRVKRDAEALQQ